MLGFVLENRMTDTNDWRAAVWAAFRARMLTRSARDVMLTLASFKGPGGRIWPSHALLAARARVCVKTVVRAMQQGREAGLIAWKPIRWRTPAGFWRRKSNLYVVRVPLAEAMRPKLGRFDPKGAQVAPLGGKVPHRGTPMGHPDLQAEQVKKDKGLGGKTVAQQLAALAVSSVGDARAALAQVAERMREKQRAARGV